MALDKVNIAANGFVEKPQRPSPRMIHRQRFNRLREIVRQFKDHGCALALASKTCCSECSHASRMSALISTFDHLHANLRGENDVRKWSD
jgi:hypothetical protein